MTPEIIAERDTAHEEGRRAGYRQGLEDAAKVAERCVSPDAHPNTIASCAASNIAAAIRAMMEGKG
jgi:flagellar biosynthesis/type III secretory pathway protein FliH